MNSIRVIILVPLLVSILVCFFHVQEGKAARFTGSYLLQLCEKNDRGGEKVPKGHAICQSYIAGILDLHNMMKTISRDFPNADVCVPANVSLNSIHNTVLEYLRKNAQHDQFTAAPAVVTALYQAYPCR